MIAGVRSRQLAEVESLGVFQAVALGDETAIAGFDALDGAADTIGGEIAAKLIGKVRAGGRFAYASILSDDASARNPTVKTSRVFVRPDPTKIREFADDIRDGKFILPISQRLPLREAAAAQELMQKGRAGKIVLLPDTDWTAGQRAFSPGGRHDERHHAVGNLRSKWRDGHVFSQSSPLGSERPERN